MCWLNQDYIDPETDLLYLGDIVISYEQAKLQADEHKWAVHEECALLTIHGTLHLLVMTIQILKKR